MSFVSITFLAFYTIVLLSRFTIGRSKRNNSYLYSLLFFSFLFYGWHVPQYIFLLLISILTSFWSGIALSNTCSQIKRRSILVLVILVNLSILGFFKYAGFLLSLAFDLDNGQLFDHSFSVLNDIVLPVGISFYTFQAISYTVDNYQYKIAAERSLGRFSLYIAFFPQLVAGPILRASEFLYQCSRRRYPRARIFFWGFYLIIRGLFFKIVIADNLGEIVDRYWPVAGQQNPPETLAFTLLLLFACQLLCDFMGYTDIARGIAYQLGFRLPINFNAPFLAVSFSGFWRRWHITLSSWMRDYIFIVLGGSRKNRWFTSRNIIIVMLISGLWHGAGLNFIIWGAMLGFGLIIERLVGRHHTKTHKGKNTFTLPSVTSVCLWYLVVQLTWIFSMAFFRSQELTEAWQVLQNSLHGFIMLPVNGLTLNEDKGHMGAAVWLMIPVFLLHLRTFISEQFEIRSRVWERCIYAGFMTFSLMTIYATDQQFIYFQF